MAQIIDGKKIAGELEENLKREVERLKKEKGLVPGLVSIIVGADPTSHLYVSLKEKVAQRVGFNFEKKIFADETADFEIKKFIQEKNSDKNIHGIWIQLPLSKLHNELELVKSLHPFKDVDCLHPKNKGLLLVGKPLFIPAVVKGVLTLLEKINFELSGKRAVVVGSSPSVGKPLSLMLSHKGATVIMIRSSEKNLKELTLMADLLISAVGKPRLITADMVKEGVVVIDIGTSDLQGKIVGDVDFEKVKDKASAITPVPGGVGPLTIISLLENALQSADLQGVALQTALLRG